MQAKYCYNRMKELYPTRTFCVGFDAWRHVHADGTEELATECTITLFAEGSNKDMKQVRGKTFSDCFYLLDKGHEPPVEEWPEEIPGVACGI